MTIDRKSPIPLYYQLKQILTQRIANGEWQPGDMLPTEEVLQEEYNLSRTTVRQALKDLEIEGVISRYRGRGTFVAKPKLTHSPEPRSSLSDTLLEQGMTPGWQLISAETETADGKVAEMLRIQPGDSVFCLRRLRLANKDPIGYHIAYVAPPFSAQISEADYTNGGSLRYLSGDDFLAKSVADRKIEAVLASEDEAEILDVDKGSAMLLIRRLVMTEDGDPIEYFKGLYRGDSFAYHIKHLPAIVPSNR